MDDLVCCPFCLAIDPNKVGVEQATGIVCRHPFHCPSPEFHGNPFRFCQWCSWSEDGEAGRVFDRLTMSWTHQVRCSNPICSLSVWRVADGVWTCQCGKPMTVAAVAEYHARPT